MVGEEQSLSRLAMRGGVVTLGLQTTKYLIQLIGVALLSRLLTPSQIGIMVVAALAAGLLDLVRDFGLPQSILGQKNLDVDDLRVYTTVAWALGLSAGLGLCLLAPIAAWIFDESSLMSVMPALSLMLVLSGGQTVMHARLLYDHKYLLLNLSEVVALLASLTIAVGLALRGWGVWALVLQYVSQSAILLALRLLSRAGNIPRFSHFTAAQRATLRRSRHIFVANLYRYASGNTDTAVVGARFGSGALGLYSRGFQLAMLPQLFITGSLGPMAVGIFGQIAQDASRTGNYIRQLLNAFIYLLVPTYIVLVSAANDIVRILLGSAWSETVEFLLPLSLSGLLLSLSAPMGWAVVASGFTKGNMFVTLLTRGVLVFFIVAGAFVSPLAVAWGFTCGSLCIWLTQTIWGARTMGLRAFGIVLQGIRGLATFLAGTAAVKLFLSFFGNLDPWWEALLVIFVVGTGFFGVYIVSGRMRGETGELRLALARAMKGGS